MATAPVRASALAIVGMMMATLSNVACAQLSTDAVQPPDPVSSRELVEIRGLSGLSVSPDAQYAVVRVDHADVEANQTLLRWQVVRLRDGQVTEVADGGLPRWSVNGNLAEETPQWSSDSQWIYFRRVEDQQLQLWRVKRTGESFEQLTHDPSDVQAFIVDETEIHYAVGPATREAIQAAEQAEYDNGVLLDGSFIQGFAPTHNFELNGRRATVRLNPAAYNFGRATLLGETPLRALTLDGDFSTTSRATDVVARRFEELWQGSVGGSLAFDPQAASRAISQSTGRNAEVLRVTKPSGANSPAPRSGRFLSWKGAGEEGGICEAPVCIDADQLSIVGWSSKGDRLIFQSRTFGVVRLNAWNVSSKSVKTLFETGGVLGASDSGLRGVCQIASKEAICIKAEPNDPAKLIAIDIGTGTRRILLDPNPGLPASRLGGSQTITLTDRFGSKTIGRVVLPSTYKPGQRVPLVITSYTCGGFLLGGSGQDVPEHVLSSMGFAAVCIDVGYETVRRVADFAFGPVSINQSGLDFSEDAIRVLEKQGIVDADRVMLTGFSGSATYTAYAIANSSKFTAAAVMTQGSLDAISCYLTAHYRSCADWAKREGQALPYDARTGILSNSPAWNVERITTPLLMQLPETEYTGMMQLFGAMTDYNRAVEMYVFADANHHKNQPRQRLSVYERNVDWAQFWLKGVESPDPSRAQQNVRWKELRKKQCELFRGDQKLPDAPWYCSAR